MLGGPGGDRRRRVPIGGQMSASEEPRPSSRVRWRAPLTGAVTGLAVAAAIVVPSAIAAGGQSSGQCVGSKAARAMASPPTAADSVPSQFFAAVAQLERAGTITAAQARTLDADIQSGSIDPKKLIADGVLTVSEMNAVNHRLIGVKMSLASQMQASSSASGSAPSKGG